MSIIEMIKPGFLFVAFAYLLIGGLLSLIKSKDKKSNRRANEIFWGSMPASFFLGSGLCLLKYHESLSLSFNTILLIIFAGYILLLFFGFAIAEKKDD